MKLQLAALLGSVLHASAGQCDSTETICVGTGPVCTDECDGGYSCKAMANAYGCAKIVTYSNCNKGKCDCTCPPGAPVPAPTDAKTGSCTGKTSSACFSDLAQWQIDSVIAKHNEYRANHGACPLTYDTAIAAYSVGSSGFQKTCNQKSLQHNSPPQYSGGRLGENLAMVGGKKDLHNWDPADGVHNWYCGEEGCWNYNTATESGTTGHMTQVVWKDTTKVGCGLCHVDSGSFLNVYLICNYESPGNFGSMGSGGGYDKNVGAPGETATGCSPSPPTGTNECDSNPCGAGQTCNDPNNSKSKDYTCTCDAYPSVVATGGQATCEDDECSSTPCGMDQDCNDPNKASNSLHDFVCSCKSDNTITKTDAPAVCTKNECDANPCDASQSQTCNDPNPSPSNLKDYTCTCPNGVVATGGSVAKCIVDECDSNPCGSSSEQTCNDPNTAANMLHDFICKCKADTAVQNVDGPATCSKDECSTNPCDASQSQTCADPNPSPSSLKDFTCTCPNGVIATGASVAKCIDNECDASPCGMDQTCTDPNTASNNLHDFICACKSDTSIKNTDGPAACSKNECDAQPCGSQMCSDPNTSPKSLNDFTCECTNGVTATGAAAICETDECASFDCGMGQSCTDANTASNSLHDFECSCDNDASLKKTDGQVAKCTTDECATSPCGSQTCNDPNTSAGSLNDFTCSCPAPNQSIMQTGKPATCSMGGTDECAATPSPCGTNQDCNDPDTTAGSLNDFVCGCKVGSGSNVGAPAACKLNECDASPCGAGQDCNDANDDVASTGDYTCKCRSPLTGELMGGSATCVQDECLSTPCGAGQMCVDPTTTPTSLLDYRCSCGNGAIATGAPAKCDIDECAVLTNPCGSNMDQDCSDPNTASTSQGDFVCTCKSDPLLKQTGSPATCSKNECDANPCDMAQGQVCNDPTPSLASVKDFTCTCPNGVMATGGSVAACVIDECNPSPCGSGQDCNDPDTAANKLHDFICTCQSNSARTRVDGPATCSKNECDGNPCDATQNQVCDDPVQSLSSVGDYTCTCPNGVKSTGSVPKCSDDECLNDPCGSDQKCADPNTDADSLHDFVCTCKSDSAITNVDGPARCGKDECDSNPCGSEQTCIDSKKDINSLNDYVCRCPNGGPSATGAMADCGDDECQMNPCGEGQICKDFDRTTRGNFDCSCPFGLTHNVGGPVAKCDECQQGSARNPCAWDGHPNVVETCNDPSPLATSLDDFTCTCPNGVFKVGGPADCDKTGECAQDPCGAHQICSDPDVAKTGDFICTCEADHTENTGGPVASCNFDECRPSFGIPPCPSDTQTCTDPDTSPGSLYDFVCTCIDVNGMKFEGEKVGGAAECITAFSTPVPDTESPPGSNSTPVPNTNSPLGSAATGTDEGDSSSDYWWIWLIVGIVLALCCVIAGIAMRKRKKSISMGDFSEMAGKEPRPLVSDIQRDYDMSYAPTPTFNNMQPVVDPIGESITL